ncbi:hypothetical protein BDF19DRAFT_439802 [Syncephalis fuscata]|nr:hypothetical protein BDF19DRAFT_439802 [Syncephalis fuscata]
MAFDSASIQSHGLRLPQTSRGALPVLSKKSSCPLMHQRSSSTPIARLLDEGLSSKPILPTLSTKSSFTSLLQIIQPGTRQIRVHARYIAKHLFITCSVPDTVTVSQTRDLLLLRCDLWKTPALSNKRSFLSANSTLASIFRSRNRKERDVYANSQSRRNSIDDDDDDDEEERETRWRSSFGLFCPSKGHWLDNARPLSYYEFQDKIELELHHRLDYVCIPKHLYHEAYAHGYLLIKSKAFLKPTFWKRQWVVLQGSQLYQYHSSTDSEPRHTIDLSVGFTLRWRRNDRNHYSTAGMIEIIVNLKSIHITAEDETELRHWHRIFDGLDATIKRKSRSVDMLQIYESMDWIPPQWRSDSSANSLHTANSARSSIYNLDLTHSSSVIAPSNETATPSEYSSSRLPTQVPRSGGITHNSSIFVLRKPSVSRQTPIDPRPVTMNYSYLTPNIESHTKRTTATTNRPRLMRFSSSQSLKCCFLWPQAKGHRRSSSQDTGTAVNGSQTITPPFGLTRPTY